MRFKRSKINLSNFHNTTMNMGKLVPVNCVEVLPGDSFRASTSALIRVSPLLAPVMHPVQVRLHHFFVPTRLVWSSWEDFITGGSDGNNADTVPTINTAAGVGTLANYLGVPEAASARNINALPIRCYNKIYNEFYRDQDLVTAVTEDTNTIQNIAWEKDYQTASRPWTQKGTATSVPVGTSAPIAFEGTTGQEVGVYESDGTAGRIGAGTVPTWESSAPSGGNYLYADLSSAIGADVNDVRLAFATQNYQELRAKYGSNYVDYLSYLGITPQDSRLQRPEYLGGGKQTISFSEVLQTAPESASSSNVGDFGGHGIAAVKTNNYQKFFPEHGYVITLCSVRPKSIYNQSEHRMWHRTDKEDYYQRELEGIGQQAVLNKEVYCDDTGRDLTFGYADRYSEYRSHPSRVSGKFTVNKSLDHWNLARAFSSDVALNQTFVECTPSTRIYAATSEDQLLCMFQNHVVSRRMVQKFVMPNVL